MRFCDPLTKFFLQGLTYSARSYRGHRISVSKYNFRAKSYSACIYNPKTPKFFTGSLLLFILTGPVPRLQHQVKPTTVQCPGEDFGHKQSRSPCFQDQPVTHVGIFHVSFIKLEDLCVYFSNGVGNFLAVFNLNRLDSQTQPALNPEALTRHVLKNKIKWCLCGNSSEFTWV